MTLRTLLVVVGILLATAANAQGNGDYGPGGVNLALMVAATRIYAERCGASRSKAST